MKPGLSPTSGEGGLGRGPSVSGNTFRATQVLTGHGCFGRYLHLVARREPTPKCHHCSGCNEDTAEHTLAYCPAFAEQRRVLVAKIGPDLSLATVVATMRGSDESW